MRDSAFATEVALDVSRPLQPVWVVAVALSLCVIGWLFARSLPGALSGCCLLAGALGGHWRESRLHSIRLDPQGRWFGRCTADAMHALAPTRQIVLRDLILLGFRAGPGAPRANVVLTPASAGEPAFRRLAARLRFGLSNGAPR
jgi:hypothetical protein